MSSLLLVYPLKNASTAYLKTPFHNLVTVIHRLLASYLIVYYVIKLLCLFFDLQLFCIGALIAAAMAIATINKVEDDYSNELGGEYENTESYRAAAVYLVTVTASLIVLHAVMISIRIFYSGVNVYLSHMQLW